jgi:hypothetical protein
MKKLLLLALYGCLATVVQAQQRHDLQLGLRWMAVPGFNTQQIGATAAWHRSVTNHWALGLSGGYHQTIETKADPLAATFQLSHLSVGIRYRLLTNDRLVQWSVEPVVTGMLYQKHVPEQPASFGICATGMTDKQIEDLLAELERQRQPHTDTYWLPGLGLTTQCSVRLSQRWSVGVEVMVNGYRFAQMPPGTQPGWELFLSPGTTLVYAW